MVSRASESEIRDREREVHLHINMHINMRVPQCTCTYTCGHVRIACIQTGTHAYTYESTYKDPAQAKAPPLASQGTIKKSSLGFVFFCIVVCA